jgi:hypothetical protein
MVWEMLYNPDYSLPTADAVAAWHRAMGKQPDAEAEEVRGARQRRALLVVAAAAWPCAMLTVDA